METERKVCIAIALCMIVYMFSLYKQMNTFKSTIESNNKKTCDDVYKTLESYSMLQDQNKNKSSEIETESEN